MHRLGNWLVPSDMSNVDFRPLIPLKSAGLGYSSLPNNEIREERLENRARWSTYKNEKVWIPQYYGVPYDEVKDAWTEWKPGEYDDFYESYPHLTWNCLSPFPDGIEDVIDDYYAILDRAEAKKVWKAEMVTSHCYPEDGKSYDDYENWRPSLRIADDDSELDEENAENNKDGNDEDSPHSATDRTRVVAGKSTCTYTVAIFEIFIATTSEDDAAGDDDTDMLIGGIYTYHCKKILTDRHLSG